MWIINVCFQCDFYYFYQFSILLTNLTCLYNIQFLNDYTFRFIYKYRYMVNFLVHLHVASQYMYFNIPYIFLRFLIFSHGEIHIISYFIFWNIIFSKNIKIHLNWKLYFFTNIWYYSTYFKLHELTVTNRVKNVLCLKKFTLYNQCI